MFRNLKKNFHQNYTSPVYHRGKTEREAQTFLEYAILISVVAAALVAMSPGIRRSIQSILKVTSDQLALQNEADQVFNLEKGGWVSFQNQVTHSNRVTERRETPSGTPLYRINQVDETHQNVQVMLELLNTQGQY